MCLTKGIFAFYEEPFYADMLFISRCYGRVPFDEANAVSGLRFVFKIKGTMS